jgi:hypothetical protein
MLGPPGKLWADNTVGMELINGGSNVMGGVYTGPYNLTVTVNGQPTSVQLVCDDAEDEVSEGETWQAYTSTFPNLSNVQFAKGTGGQNYEEAAWLAQQLFANEGTPNSATTTGEIQWAIWDVFDPGTCNTGISNCDPWGDLSNYQAGINSWLSLAQSNFSTGNYSNLVIYTAVPGSQNPLGDGRPQEFLGVGTPQAPEPMTLWSLLIVLAAIALACKWVDRTAVKSSASAGL